MLSRRHFLASAALGTAGAALPWVAGSAEASVSRAQTVEQLAKASCACIVGTPVDSESRWATWGGQRRIVTETRVLIDDLVGGEFDESEAMVRTLGGQVGDVGQVVHGEAVLVRHRLAVLFLSVDGAVPTVTAMAQGHYPVRADRHGTARLALSPRLGHLVGIKGTSATVRLRDRDVSAATSLIRSAWGRHGNNDGGGRRDQ
jgi:hypothetical protein